MIARHTVDVKAKGIRKNTQETQKKEILGKDCTKKKRRAIPLQNLRLLQRHVVLEAYNKTCANDRAFKWHV